jgi:uncharacterized protein (TIGR01319 family)
MKKLVLLIDFGSTFTKLTLVDPNAMTILHTTQLPTSNQAGLQLCYTEGKKALLQAQKLSEQVNLEEYFCSSAWGGFKMIAIGLTKSLTLEAAKRAALGAGSRILQTYCYRLTPVQLKDIQQQKPDVVLLSGGSNGGNQEIICHNAQLLAQLPPQIALIVAGNEDTYGTLANILQGRKNTYFTENVMPEVNKLNPIPVRKIAQEVFLEKIIHSKGIQQVAAHTNAPIIPTPTAVLAAAKLLKEGTKTIKGLGELVVVDIGGATTDIHSVGYGLPQAENVFFEGLEEPYLKRTVEGDLGMRSSAVSLLESLLENSQQIQSLPTWKQNSLQEACAYRRSHPNYVPQTQEERQIDQFLAQSATAIALKRHAGKRRKEYTPNRTIYYQQGKDLQHFQTIIGTGGVIIHSPSPEDLFKSDSLSTDTLLPVAPQIIIDQDYLLSAMGLLSQHYPEAALTILKKKLYRLNT